MSEQLKCPRCESDNFREIDCGADSYEDDIFYISEICTECGLYHSGWTDKWLTDCDSWTYEEYCSEFKP